MWCYLLTAFNGAVGVVLNVSSVTVIQNDIKHKSRLHCPYTSPPTLKHYSHFQHIPLLYHFMSLFFQAPISPLSSHRPRPSHSSHRPVCVTTPPTRRAPPPPDPSSVVSSSTGLSLLVSTHPVVVLLVTRPGCPACVRAKQVVARLEQQWDQQIRWVFMNGYDVPELAQNLGVRAMPTFVVWKNGKRKDHFVGCDAAVIQSNVEDYL